MGDYFFFSSREGDQTFDFWREKIAKSDVASVGMKSAKRSTIIELFIFIFLGFIAIRLYFYGFSYFGLGATIIAIALLLLVANFWGRRIVLTLKSGRQFRSPPMQLPEAEKVVSAIRNFIQ